MSPRVPFGELAVLVALGIAMLAPPTTMQAAEPGLSRPGPTARQLSAKAQALLHDLRTDRAGVDRNGNLWTWSFDSGRVELFSTAGERIASAEAGPAIGVDADLTWGVAAIHASGRQLHLIPWNGPARSIPLEENGRGVAWLGPEAVAVGLDRSAYRAQIWNTRERVPVKMLGTEQPLTPRPGVTRLRAMLLDYSERLDLLFTMESFTGDLQVFALDGRLVHREIIPRKGSEQVDLWMTRMDEEARERGEIQTPAISWFSLAVDEHGTAWVVEDCDKSAGRMKLLKVRLGKESEGLNFAEPCCSRYATVWGGWLATIYDPTSPTRQCNTVRRLP